MINVKQACIVANGVNKNLQLVSVLDFGKDFGFLFAPNKSNFVLGSGYVLVNKETKAISILPTTPNNIDKIQSAKKLSLTLVR